MGRLFDTWPEKYDAWFETPIGFLVKKYESELIMDLLRPKQGEMILDAGCGTGVFTFNIIRLGTFIVGLDISLPMLKRAEHKAGDYPFRGVIGDMMNLPFPDGSFEKVVSITALEFIKDAKGALDEMFRVTKRCGRIVVATLNSLSPWAQHRRVKAQKGKTIFDRAIFRSPEEIAAIAPIAGEIRTAIHFSEDDDPELVPEIESEGHHMGFKTGAFIVARWEKPGKAQ